MPLCFRRCSFAVSRVLFPQMGTDRRKLAAHPGVLARSFESAVTGLGSETVMRVPQTEQNTHPACSTTEGTVLNLRWHFGHWTSMICTNWGP